MIKKTISAHEQKIVEMRELLLKKEWLCYEDICYLYGYVSKGHMDKIRERREVEFTTHPFKKNEFIYFRADIDEKLNFNRVAKRIEK